MTALLPLGLAKQIRRECLYSGCHDPAGDDSDYCAPHEAHERGRAANRQRRYRQKLADSGLCVAGCGRKIPRQRDHDGRVRRRRCTKCRRDDRDRKRAAREKPSVTGGSRPVTGDPHWRTEADVRPERAGQTTQRYVGKQRRGRLTREQQIDEDKRDVKYAIDELGKFLRALEQLKLPEVMGLPPIQRDAARREAAQFLGTAGRQIDDLLDKYGG